MKKLEWLDVPADWHARIDACLQFFGADSLQEWEGTYAQQLQGVRFRTSPTFPNQVSAVSAWLRAGEIARSQLKRTRFDADEFALAIDEMRPLSRIPDPKTFIPKLQSITSECGVACVIVPTPDGCAASGASRVLEDGTAIIQLSARYLSDDQFWFSFFHEVGHLILHRERAIHVDGDSEAFETCIEETQANSFSADVLWPFESRLESRFMKKPSRRDIVRLAAEVGTSPGIIIGQLQNEGVLEYTEYNNLKRRYRRSGHDIVLRR
ncbi:ImmA/IrrE family metallo-endopeptidase [Arthrobacter sp. zg-Y750]|uniref:ImmA/IrrE family metallo-endopeptidase n=1 Tax=Arthrobacter sp. zg-Y750 TaxID=2894189 RepID=UPI001E305DF1|nr:ImmA/IrrE family metallo-endopeptidase [Arthrobacter sp. zg-Y750]MCC9178763.1 ImmA/IrrE family metallo-endopeptidase [Arthrobacter sp. zg-Y750]